MHKVAVYGSLREGLGNNYLLGDSPFIKSIIIDGFEMFDNMGYFPYLFYTGDKQQSIIAEVYSVDDETMIELDHLEGISENNDDTGHYKRRMIGDSDVWIYIGTGDSGDMEKVPNLSEMIISPDSEKYNYADWTEYLKYRNEYLGIDSNDSMLSDETYKFLNNIYLDQLKSIDKGMYYEIIQSIDDDTFENYYEELYRDYEDSNGNDRIELGKCLTLIDKALSSDNSLQQIETTVQPMLGESTNLYMENLLTESHNVLSALLEEIKNAP